MVFEIRLSNFFSIKDEICLDLRAAKRQSAQTRSLASNVFNHNKTQLLKSVAIYGANASGKSNIVKAIQFCIKMILNSHNHNENDTLNFMPYKFDNYDKKPSCFFIHFVCNDIEYEYSFCVTTSEIITESLYYYPKGRRALLYERDERKGTDKKGTYKFAQELKRPFDIANNTSRKTLFLSRASNLGRDWAQNLYRFFNEEFLFNLNYSVTQETLLTVKDDILKALRIADFDIVDFQTENVMIPTESVSFTINGSKTPEIVQKQELVPQLIIKTYHKQNPDIPFNLKIEESEGTRKIFYLMVVLTEIIKTGKILLIDELDRNLHPLLVKYIVSMFHNSEKAQILFTTHNTNLLNMKEMRKDQIYFVNKKRDGSSDLYSLFDFKDFRENMDVEKAYMQGRFDAIPFIAQ